MEVVGCQVFQMLVSCACKFQINPWQPFLYAVNVVHHNSLCVDLKDIFKFGKHRYIDDMVNNFSKFKRPLSTSALAALFHMNKMKYSHVAYRPVRGHNAELSFSLSAGKESNARADLGEVHCVHVHSLGYQKKDVFVKKF